MTPQQALQTLQRAGYVVAGRNAIPNGTGITLRLQTGQIVNLFHTGTVQVQGHKPKAVRELLERSQRPDAMPRRLV